MFVYIITLLDSPACALQLAASSVLSELTYLLQRFNLFICHLASLPLRIFGKILRKTSENYFGKLRKTTSENFGKLRKTSEKFNDKSFVSIAKKDLFGLFQAWM